MFAIRSLAWIFHILEPNIVDAKHLCGKKMEISIYWSHSHWWMVILSYYIAYKPCCMVHALHCYLIEYFTQFIEFIVLVSLILTITYYNTYGMDGIYHYIYIMLSLIQWKFNLYCFICPKYTMQRPMYLSWLFNAGFD